MNSQVIILLLLPLDNSHFKQSKGKIGNLVIKPVSAGKYHEYISYLRLAFITLCRFQYQLVEVIVTLLYTVVETSLNICGPKLIPVSSVVML